MEGEMHRNELEIRRLEEYILKLEKRLEGIRNRKKKKNVKEGRVLGGTGEFFERTSFFGDAFWKCD